MGFTGYSKQIVNEVHDVIMAVSADEVAVLVEQIIQSKRLFLEGRGRSGLMMRAFAVRLTHLDIHCHVVGESTTPSLLPGDLLLIGSGSGETITPIHSAEAAKKAGGAVAVLTSRRESRLAILADTVVIIPAPVRQPSDITPVKTIQPMSSLFEQALLLLLDAIVLMLKERLQQDDLMMMTRHSNLE